MRKGHTSAATKYAKDCYSKGRVLSKEEVDNLKDQYETLSRTGYDKYNNSRTFRGE